MNAKYFLDIENERSVTVKEEIVGDDFVDMSVNVARKIF